MHHRVIPLRSHYSLSDLVLASAAKELHTGISKGTIESPELVEVQKFFSDRLDNASETMPFKNLSMSIQLASNLSSHDLKPFVHVFTSLPDQGTGPLDLLYARKRILQEVMFSSGESSSTFRTFEKTEDAIDKGIAHIEAESSMVDGSIQVPLGEFFEDPDFGAIVSESKDFRLFFPDLQASRMPTKSKDFSWGHGSNTLYPADTTVYFQVHSRISNHEGNDSYELTGTGHIHLSTMIKRVLQERKKAHGRDAEFVSMEIPLILNCVSAQDPKAKLVDHVSSPKRSGAEEDLESEGKALYEGSLFLHIDLEDKDTHQFFSSLASGRPVFEELEKRDITEGNFSHVANTMRYHVIRDMSPFIPEFTSSIPISVEYTPSSGRTGNRTIGDPIIRETKGWVFQPSLKEGERIHAPYNKGTVHTMPGFTYYHDKMMQRLPDTRFILNTARIVLDRHGFSERAFVHASNNVVKETKSGEMYLNPKYIDVLNITSEILCAFPTAMNYRGDYADMNTGIREALRKSQSYFDSHKRFHHMEHATGLTRVPAVPPKHKSKWHHGWDRAKKTGTEMFGDATIDRSGDCEDFAKLINRVIAGINACNTTHPLVTSLQSVLGRYKAYSVLSSVTSASIMTAPDAGDPVSPPSRKGFSHESAGAKVGSAKDLRANIGAHMFTVLIPNRMEERALEATRGSSSGILRSSESSRSSENSRLENKAEDFIADTIPPMVLEGTGPARALLLPQETYHKTMADKVKVINGEMLRVEATARLLTGMPSEQVTAEGLREANTVFSPFTLPIKSSTLVDLNLDERVSSFYRMPVEMFLVENGATDVRVTPKELVSIQMEINEKRAGSTKGESMMGIHLEKYLESESAKESEYFRSRVIPVQLQSRTSENNPSRAGDEPIIGYTYGINMTDIAHRREDLFGLLKTVRSSPAEKQAIDAIMRHANPSVIITVAPQPEALKARKLAKKYQDMLNANIDQTLSRGYMGREEDLHTINLYVRTDNVKEEDMRKLASHLSQNGYTGHEPARVVAESFARGHHLLRVSVPVDVTEAKQLYLEDTGKIIMDNNALAERLGVPAERLSRKEREEAIQYEEKTILVNKLKKLLMGK